VISVNQFVGISPQRVRELLAQPAEDIPEPEKKPLKVYKKLKVINPIKFPNPRICPSILSKPKHDKFRRIYALNNLRVGGTTIIHEKFIDVAYAHTKHHKKQFKYYRVYKIPKVHYSNPWIIVSRMK